MSTGISRVNHAALFDKRDAGQPAHKGAHTPAPIGEPEPIYELAPIDGPAPVNEPAPTIRLGDAEIPAPFVEQPNTLPGVIGQLNDPVPLHKENRFWLAEWAAVASIKSGGYKQLFDGLRLLPKIPESFEIERKLAGVTTGRMFDPLHRNFWQMFNMKSNRVGISVRQTVTVAPTTTILDPLARVEGSAAYKAGMTFNKVDAFAYRASSIAGTFGAALQLISAGPNLWDALQEDGLPGLGNTTSGRTGVAQALGGGLAIYLLGRAGYKAWRGTELVAPVRGPVKLFMAATGSSSLSKPWTATVGFGSGGFVLANEAGFMDGWNKGETRSGGEIFGAAAEQSYNAMPLLGD